jgi:hypothetical protein
LRVRCALRRYIFANPSGDGWLKKGPKHCVVLKPTVHRIDESEDLLEVINEYENQLRLNR